MRFTILLLSALSLSACSSTDRQWRESQTALEMLR